MFIRLPRRNQSHTGNAALSRAREVSARMHGFGKFAGTRLRRGAPLGLAVAFLVAASATAYSESAPEAASAASRQVETHELGLPSIRHYTPREYGQAGQNWALTQGPDGLIYAGNNHGVLQYDGERWRLIRVANHSAVRSLAVADDGRIYVGAQREMGYLEPDQAGQLQYHTMIDRIPEHVRDFLDVWEIFIRHDGVYFATFDRLLRWNGERFDWWEPQTSYHRAFDVGGRIIIRDRGAGLMEMGSDGLEPIAGGARFADIRIDVMLPWPGPAGQNALTDQTEILVGTREEGFLIFDGQSWRRWSTQVDNEIRDALLYTGTWLPDGRLALGTTQAGVYFVNLDGSFGGHLDRAAGMEDEIVRFLHVDHQDGLWMALDGGIARARGDVSLTRFDGRRGLPGRVNALHRHDGQLYAATNHALFALNTDPQPGFERVEAFQAQTWALVSVGNELLAANNDGVFKVTGRAGEMIRRSERASFSLLASRFYPGRVYVGLSNGLAVLERTDDGWHDRGRVAGVWEQVRNMHELDDGRLWLGTAHSGAIRLQMPADLNSAELVPLDREDFHTGHGLPHLDRNFVYSIDSEPVFTTSKGLMRFDEETQRFLLDPRFSDLFKGEPRRLTAIRQGPDGRIWMHARNDETGEQETGAAVPAGNGVYRWQSLPLQKLSGIYTYSIWSDDSGTLWFGGDEGLFRFEPAHAREAEWPFRALIRLVEIEGGRLLYGGHGELPNPTLTSTENQLRFELAAPSFIPRESIHYQVWLEEQDDDWSGWRREATERRGNLWEGNYRLRVRARDARGRISEEAVFAFQVLPPWYRTLWAYFIFLAGLLGLGLLAVNLYYRRLAAQNRRLQLLVDERTAELVEAEKMATVGRLVAGMAHEINTPVSNGRMTATRLSADRQEISERIQRDEPLTRGMLTRFLEECQNGLELVSSSFERIGELAGRLHRITGESETDGSQPFQLAELLDDVTALCREQTAHQGVTIRISCPDTIRLSGNRLVLTECFNELISNSLEHGFESIESGASRDRTITIEVRTAADRVIIDYRDNGKGLSSEVENRIFEPFAAGMQPSTRHPGLGMHMLFQMIHRVLGGTIAYRPSDDGIHFVIDLPLSAGQTRA